MISPWDAWPKSLFSWVKDSYGSGMGIVWVPLTIRGSHVLGGPWKFSLIELSHFPPKKVTALVLQGSLWSNNSSGDQSLTRGSANRCHLWQRNKVCKCSCDSLIFWWVMDVIIFLGGDGFQFKYFVCSPLFGEKHIYIYIHFDEYVFKWVVQPPTNVFSMFSSKIRLEGPIAPYQSLVTSCPSGNSTVFHRERRAEGLSRVWRNSSRIFDKTLRYGVVYTIKEDRLHLMKTAIRQSAHDM